MLGFYIIHNILATYILQYMISMESVIHFGD